MYSFASVLVLLQIPADVSWNAFLKLCNKVDVSTLLRTLDPLKVHKVSNILFMICESSTCRYHSRMLLYV